MKTVCPFLNCVIGLRYLDGHGCQDIGGLGASSCPSSTPTSALCPSHASRCTAFQKPSASLYLSVHTVLRSEERSPWPSGTLPPFKAQRKCHSVPETHRSPLSSSRPPLLSRVLSPRGAQALGASCPVAGEGPLSAKRALLQSRSRQPHGPSHSSQRGATLHAGWGAAGVPPRTPRSLQSWEGFAVTSENTRSPRPPHRQPCGFSSLHAHGSQPPGDRDRGVMHVTM